MAHSIDESIPTDGGFVNKESGTTYSPQKIKVIGVGGGGNNAINHMWNMGVRNVSFIVANTDRQALLNSPVPTKVLLGPSVLGGRGAGNVPEKARDAAEESANDINNLFEDDTDMVFITAGMGGGTGTGAAPVISRIARERGLLTIGIVTIPFLFEGAKKIMKALEGANEMRKYVDALLVINNERLSEIYPDCTFINAFGKADDILTMAAMSISEIVTSNGYINLDFNDVDNTLRDGGTAIISTGYGEGENRVTKAIEDALHSPLLRNTDIFGSKKLLFNLYFSPKAEEEFKIDETNQISSFISRIDTDVDVIWGVSFDDTLGNKVKFTILAAGFDMTTEKDLFPEANEPILAKDKQTNDADDILSLEYGADALGKMADAKNEGRFHIFKVDELDDDDAINSVNASPALDRDRRKFGSALSQGENVLSRQESNSKNNTIDFNDLR